MLKGGTENSTYCTNMDTIFNLPRWLVYLEERLERLLFFGSILALPVRFLVSVCPYMYVC